MSRATFSPRARRDLAEIGDYIARSNPRRALSFVEEIWEHCQHMALMPLAYPSRERIGPGIRKGLHGRYLILFRPSSDGIRIERIVHGARLPSSML